MSTSARPQDAAAQRSAPSGHSRSGESTHLGPALGLALGGGALAGALTLIAWDVLPGPWGQVANSFAAWCLLAHLTGRLVRPRPGRPAAQSGAAAAAVGVLALLSLVAGYYGLLVLQGRSDAPAKVAFWVAAALPAGAAFALAGHARWARSAWVAGLGAAGVGALFPAEVWGSTVPPLWAAREPLPAGVEHVVPTAAQLVVALLWAALGLLLTVVLAGGGRRRCLAVALFVPVAVVMVVALEAAVGALAAVS